MHWYGKDRHYWFSKSLIVPESFDNKPLWLKIFTQIEEWDDAKNPQFLLFINGEIVQGVDMNHREILISKTAKKVMFIKLIFKLILEYYILNLILLLSYLKEMNKLINYFGI